MMCAGKILHMHSISPWKKYEYICDFSFNILRIFRVRKIIKFYCKQLCIGTVVLPILFVCAKLWESALYIWMLMSGREFILDLMLFIYWQGYVRYYLITKNINWWFVYILYWYNHKNVYRGDIYPWKYGLNIPGLAWHTQPHPFSSQLFR